MAKAEIMAGACGYTTHVNAEMTGPQCSVQIESACPAIQKMAAHLTQVDPLKEITSRRAVPQTLEAGIKYCTHAACPVPAAIIKTIEIAAGLNLPVDPVVKLSR